MTWILLLLAVVASSCWPENVEQQKQDYAAEFASHIVRVKTQVSRGAGVSVRAVNQAVRLKTGGSQTVPLILYNASTETREVLVTVGGPGLAVDCSDCDQPVRLDQGERRNLVPMVRISGEDDLLDYYQVTFKIKNAGRKG